MVGVLLLIGISAFFFLPGTSVAKKRKKQYVAPPELGLKANRGRGRVGNHVVVAGTTFMVWGGEKSGAMPKGLTISRDGKKVFAANLGRRDRNTIAVYNAIPFKFEKFLHYEGNSIELATSVDSKLLFSTNMKHFGYLDIIDMATFELKQHLRIKGFPKVILVDPEGQYLYLSLWSGNGIARYKLPEMTEERLITKGRARHGKQGYSKKPRGMALSKDGKTLYAANNDDRSLSIIDVATFKERKRLNIGWAPRHVVLRPDGKKLYVSLTTFHRVAEVDTESETIIRKIRVGRKPKTIALSKDGKFLYSADYDGHSVTFYHLETDEKATLDLNILRVSGLDVHPSDQFLYATGWCTNDVWAIQRIDQGQMPLRPFGRQRGNIPCYGCEMPWTGCPATKDVRAHVKRIRKKRQRARKKQGADPGSLATP